jgi:hypothetical protein
MLYHLLTATIVSVNIFCWVSRMELEDFWPKEEKKGIEGRVAALLNGDVGWEDLLGVVVAQAELVATLVYSSKRTRHSGPFVGEHGVLFKQMLRTLVDNWLRSGQKNEMDEPWARIVPVEDIDDFWQQNRPEIFQEADGRLRVRLGSHYQLNDQSSWARNLAISLFIRLLDSAERERLSVCMECGRYFVRKRRPKRNAAIKLGSWCQNHRDRRKIRSVNATRDTCRARLVQLAAQLSSRHEREKPREMRSAWIVRMVNREILRRPKWYCRPPIKGKWVKQNEDDIEREVEKQHQLSAGNLDV